MKSSAAFGLSMGELPTGNHPPTPTPACDDVTRAAVDPRELNNAIDVIACLTEQAERMAGKGANELAMSATLSAAFHYLVSYCHYLATERNAPDTALAKAAAGLPELGTAEMDFLRAISGMHRPQPA